MELTGIPTSKLTKNIHKYCNKGQYKQLSVCFLIFLTIMCFSNLILLSPTEFSAIAPQSLTTNNSLIQNTLRPSIMHSYTNKQLKEIHNHVKSTNLTNLPFQTITTICELRLNNRTRKKGAEQEEKYYKR